MARLYSNNATSTLASSITTASTTITVATGDGSKYPNVVYPDYFTITLTQAGGTETSWEEVKVTARSGDTLTVVRAQEGSVAAAWPSGTLAEIRWTAEAAMASANNGVAGEAVLDFGPAPGSTYAEVVISGQTGINQNSQCSAFIMLQSSADHNDIEHAIVPLKLTAGSIVDDTSFKIVGISDMRLTGQWAVQWVRTV